MMEEIKTKVFVPNSEIRFLWVYVQVPVLNEMAVLVNGNCILIVLSQKDKVSSETQDTQVFFIILNYFVKSKSSLFRGNVFLLKVPLLSFEVY